MNNAIGLIETIGLAAGITAADTAVKSANVKLIGYEFSKGSGMTTVKIEGDVGAVKAAIESAEAEVLKMSKVYSKLVIPRPGKGIEPLIFNDETVGYAPKEEKPVKTAPAKRAAKPKTQTKTTAKKTSANSAAKTVENKPKNEEE